MISEKAFIKKISLWNEYTPWLLDYVRTDHALGRRLAKPIDIAEESKHVYINNIIAVVHYKNLCKDGSIPIETSYDQSESLISIFSEKSLNDYKLTDDYKKIVSMQAERLLALYGNRVTHGPMFSGYGALMNCQGDLYMDGSLVEIKAHQPTPRKPRPFDIMDFRQLLVYCTLNYLSENPLPIKTIQLFNPRMAYQWQVNVDIFIFSITGSSTSIFYENMANHLTDMTDFTDIHNM